MLNFKRSILAILLMCAIILPISSFTFADELPSVDITVSSGTTHTIASLGDAEDKWEMYESRLTTAKVDLQMAIYEKDIAQKGYDGDKSGLNDTLSNIGVTYIAGKRPDAVAITGLVRQLLKWIAEGNRFELYLKLVDKYAAIEGKNTAIANAFSDREKFYTEYAKQDLETCGDCSVEYWSCNDKEEKAHELLYCGKPIEYYMYDSLSGNWGYYSVGTCGDTYRRCDSPAKKISHRYQAVMLGGTDSYGNWGYYVSSYQGATATAHGNGTTTKPSVSINGPNGVGVSSHRIDKTPNCSVCMDGSSYCPNASSSHPSSGASNDDDDSTDTTDTTTTDTSSTTDDDDDDSSSGNSIGPASGYSDTGTAGLSYAVKLTSSGALDQVKWYLKGPGDSSATLWSTNDYYGNASESTFYYCFPGSVSGDYEFTAEVKPRSGDSYSTSFTVSVTTD